MTYRDRQIEARLKAQEKRITELERKLARKNKINTASVWTSDRIWDDEDVIPGQIIMSQLHGPHFMGEYSVDELPMAHNGALGQHYHHHNSGGNIDLALQLEPTELFLPVDISTTVDFANPPTHPYVLDYSDGVHLKVPLGGHILILVRATWGQNVDAGLDGNPIVNPSDYDKAIKIVRLPSSGTSDGDTYSDDGAGRPLSYWHSGGELLTPPLTGTGLSEITYYTTYDEMRFGGEVDLSAVTQAINILDKGTWQIRYMHNCGENVLVWFSIKIVNLGNWRFP